MHRHAARNARWPMSSRALLLLRERLEPSLVLSRLIWGQIARDSQDRAGALVGEDSLEQHRRVLTDLFDIVRSPLHRLDVRKHLDSAT